MSKPKLALIPSGYKGGSGEGTLYSILPNDATGDFDYERNGNASRVRKDGLIEELTVDDTPRLDWLNSNCPSLLLEPQRLNSIIQSQDLTTSWSVFNGGSISSNQIIAPNGELEADELITNGTGFSFVKPTSNPTISTGNNTFTIFAKKGTSDQLWLRLDYGTTIYNRKFNLTTQTISAGFDNIANIPNEESIEDYGNGWYRLRITDNADTTSFEARIYVADATSNNGDSVYLFGAQVEQGSYPTSYIKTEASPLTRLKDECLNGGDSDLFDITEGTFFVDVTPYKSDSSFTAISLNDDSANNRIEMFFYGSTNQVRFVLAGSGGGLTLSHYENITYNTRNKMAVTFNGSEAKVYLNGTLELTDPSIDALIGLDRLEFTLFNGTLNFEGKVHDTRVYDRVLTEAEAIELTTL